MSVTSGLVKIIRFLAGTNEGVSLATQEKIIADWLTIATLMRGRQPSQLRQALITADKSLDNALREVVSGETMGERLKAAKAMFSAAAYNKIWEAHKIRNRIVHESGYEPPYFMVESAIADFRAALQMLKINVS